MGPKRQQEGTWVYSPVWAALAMVGLEEIGVYTALRQNMVAQYIVTCIIMDLCLAAERKQGMRLSMRWWEKPDLDILGIRAGHETTYGEGGYGEGIIRGGGRGRVG